MIIKPYGEIPQSMIEEALLPFILPQLAKKWIQVEDGYRDSGSLGFPCPVCELEKRDYPDFTVSDLEKPIQSVRCSNGHDLLLKTVTVSRINSEPENEYYLSEFKTPLDTAVSNWANIRYSLWGKQRSCAHPEEARMIIAPENMTSCGLTDMPEYDAFRCGVCKAILPSDFEFLETLRVNG